MKFSDASTFQGLIQDIDFLLFGDGETFNTEYSLADRTRNINIVWDEAVVELYKADPNWNWDDTTNTDLPCATTDLIASQDHYSILDSALVIHEVRIKDSNGEMVTLTPALRREFTDSELQATGSPNKFFKLGNAIFPLPIPDYGASEGVEIEFQRGGNHFVSADTTKEPGFNPQFHQFLSIGAALRYAIANGMKEKIAQLRADKEMIRTAMAEYYNRRSPDERPKFRLKRPSVRSYGL